MDPVRINPPKGPQASLPSDPDWLMRFRRQTTRTLLVSTSALATIAVLFVTRIYLSGALTTPQFLISLSAYLGLLALTFLPTIPDTWRIFGFLALVYGFAAFTFYTGWLSSSGRGFLIALIALATFLAGVRAGVAAAVLSLLTYLFYALAFNFGWLSLPDLLPPSQGTPIIIEGFGFLLSVGMVGVALWFFREGMAEANRTADIAQRARAELDQRARDLDRANQLLEEHTRRLENANRALEYQMWQASGKSQLNDVIRQEQDLAPLAESMIRFLCCYVSAEIGSIFTQHDDGRFYQAGAWAMPAETKGQSFAPGEGLVGEAAVARKTLVVNDIPPGGLVVRSGLGETRPAAVLLVPLVINELVGGVMEMGFLEPPSDRRIQFLESVSESMAMAFNTVRTRQQVDALLAHEETLRQATAGHDEPDPS